MTELAEEDQVLLTELQLQKEAPADWEIAFLEAWGLLCRYLRWYANLPADSDNLTFPVRFFLTDLYEKDGYLLQRYDNLYNEQHPRQYVNPYATGALGKNRP